MRIRNPQGQAMPWREVNPDQPPSMVKDHAHPGRDIYLDWSGAIDDERHLRKCPVCNSTELFVRKDVPQLTAFVLILIAAVVAVKLYAADKTLLALVVLVAVVVVDLLIYFFASRQLVCYQCRSQYAGVPVAINQKGWDAATGERHRKLAKGTPREKSHARSFFFASTDVAAGDGGPISSDAAGGADGGGDGDGGGRGD